MDELEFPNGSQINFGSNPNGEEYESFDLIAYIRKAIRDIENGKYSNEQFENKYPELCDKPIKPDNDNQLSYFKLIYPVLGKDS